MNFVLQYTDYSRLLGSRKHSLLTVPATKVKNHKNAKRNSSRLFCTTCRGIPLVCRRKYDKALSLAEVNKDDGLAMLIEYWDAIYAEDPMSEAWSE